MASTVVIGSRPRRQKRAESGQPPQRYCNAPRPRSCVDGESAACCTRLHHSQHSPFKLASPAHSFVLFEVGNLANGPTLEQGIGSSKSGRSEQSLSPMPVKTANCYPQAVYKVILESIELASSYKLLTWKHWYMLKVVPHISPGQRLCFWRHKQQIYLWLKSNSPSHTDRLRSRRPK